MLKRLKHFKENILLHIMVWAGVKLGYDVVDLYAPGDLGELNEVRAVHFAKTSLDLHKSMRSYLEGEDG